MKLELKCRKCGFDKWEVRGSDTGGMYREDCPHCDMPYRITVIIKMLGEYNEDKED